MLRKNEYHPDQYSEYLANHHQHNMVVNTLDVSLYMFGLSMVSASVVLPAFALRLGASDIVIGLLPAVMILGYSLPQVAVSFFVEGRLRHKPWCLLLGIPQRVPWLAMGVLTVLFADTRPGLLLVMFLICFFIANLSFGFSNPAWGELIAKSIPANRRGTFMALVTVLGNGLGFLGGVIVKFVMESGYFHYPNTYAVLFFSTSAVLWVSFAVFMRNREPLLWPARKEKDLASYFRSLPRILRNDRGFRRFILSSALGTSKVMGMAFFMAHALKRFDLPDAVAGNFVMTYTAAMLLTAPLLGWLGNRFGHKPNVALSFGFYAAAASLAMLAWNERLMYAVFALMAASMAAHMVGRHNIIYQFSPEGKRPTYLALAGTLTAPFVLGFALLGGYLAETSSFGYHGPFAVSVALNLGALGILVFGVKVPAPETVPAQQAAAQPADLEKT